MRYVLSILFSLVIAAIPGPASAAGCTGPDGVAGQQMYNFQENVMQYCNGSEWRAVQGLALADIEPGAGGGTQILESVHVTCTGTLLPLVLSCTATCPAGFWRSGCFASAGTAQPSGERGCYCALADQQCTAFCLK